MNPLCLCGHFRHSHVSAEGWDWCTECPPPNEEDHDHTFEPLMQHVFDRKD